MELLDTLINNNFLIYLFNKIARFRIHGLIEYKKQRYYNKRKGGVGLKFGKRDRVRF